MATTTTAATISRSEYLKRYMSEDQKNKKKKRKSNNSTSTVRSLGGMRLLDEDTFAQPMIVENKRKLESDSEDEDNDEDLDEIDRELRALRRKSREEKARGPGFKTDSFISLEGAEPSSAAVNLCIKKESSIEPPNEAEEKSRKRGRKESSLETEKKKVAKKEVKEEPNSSGGEETGSAIETKKHRRMGDGGSAGLMTKEAMLRVEQEQRERDLQRLRDLDEDVSGRYAETRKRETGFERKRGKSRREDPEEEAKKAREAIKQAELEQKYKLWNKGVAQMKEREEKLQEMELVLEEGFTRYADDEAMNEHLREQLHEEDPMAEYFRVKNHKVQMRSGLVYPTYQGQWPQNRFTIPPGYRWDGVDRSNGFEAKVQLEKNKRKAREELTYRSIAECDG